ncbi:transglutaminase domain-containing protein [Bacillus sp. ISL-51]|uniref:transglutaminase domain-containing protein n=1 Tax=Bacteria TaxID=2 RepID=UPI001BE6DF74|nr:MULTISPECIES: transglutaminase domain-containing protein [Bacteria]MBT2572572.1 transglutaminase domain-containing protein [Bacillus sp. ISL-51]MBT2711642.1 transglutaminase domain-containing protein [Pseudomonas sp. ISL-88]
MPHDENQGSRLSLLLFYFLAFLLLWEWLRPLQNFTDTKHKGFFIVFIGLTFLLSFFRMRWYVTVPSCILFTLISIHILFYKGSILNLGWLSSFLRDVMLNTGHIGTGRWNDMNPSFRTLLFFVLLWLLVYLLHYWVIYQRKILFFFIMTVAYITVLDTFTPYDAAYAVIRIVFIGFLMMGLLYMERIRLTENIALKKRLIAKWFFPLALFICASVIFGLAAPKSDPNWPDPVPFFKKITNQHQVPAAESKIGYGNHDETLGGPFQQDDTPVFKWKGKERAYFRVETKDTYTGKGWVETDQGMSYKIDRGNVEDLWFDRSVQTKRYTAQVSIDKNYLYNHVMYPIGVSNIKPKQSVQLEMNGNTEQITPVSEQVGNIRNMGRYTLTFQSPVFKLNELRKVKVKQNRSQNQFNDRYLQLPDNLPERVGKLAEKLTRDHHNMFDKAKAIEDYLGSSAFSYQTQDVAVPKQDQDYVDQFLFETKRGYCDNFSSAMAVLLRSSGIPARWVKGYTSGEYKAAGDQNGSIYEVTNNNAHSWVEVYFPDQGWVTFEPTKGFTNPTEFTSEMKSSADGSNDSTKKSEKSSEKPREETKPKKEAAPKDQEKRSFTPNPALQKQAAAHFWPYAAALIIFAAAAALAWFFRSRWIPFAEAARLKRRTDEDAFFDAYAALLRQLKRKGYGRGGGETLRDFAARIDAAYETEDMSELTLRYERALYRNDDPAELWNESRQLWENIIKRR